MPVDYIRLGRIRNLSLRRFASNGSSLYLEHGQRRHQLNCSEPPWSVKALQAASEYQTVSLFLNLGARSNSPCGAKRRSFSAISPSQLNSTHSVRDQILPSSFQAHRQVNHPPATRSAISSIDTLIAKSASVFHDLAPWSCTCRARLSYSPVARPRREPPQPSEEEACAWLGVGRYPYISEQRSSRMSSEMSGEQMQAKIAAARRDAEGLKDKIKRKKDELADTSCKYTSCE